MQKLYLEENLHYIEEVELDPKRILCNNVILPWGFNPHNVRLFVMGNEFGAMGAVWASNDQEAFDELCDADLAGGIMVEEGDADEDYCARIGNASEPADFTHAWIAEVRLDPSQDCELICKFAVADATCQPTLDF